MLAFTAPYSKCVHGISCLFRWGGRKLPVCCMAMPTAHNWQACDRGCQVAVAAPSCLQAVCTGWVDGFTPCPPACCSWGGCGALCVRKSHWLLLCAVGLAVQHTECSSACCACLMLWQLEAGA